jgi:hypothetical protein
VTDTRELCAGPGEKPYQRPCIKARRVSVNATRCRSCAMTLRAARLVEAAKAKKEAKA